MYSFFYEGTLAAKKQCEVAFVCALHSEQLPKHGTCDVTHSRLLSKIQQNIWLWISLFSLSIGGVWYKHQKGCRQKKSTFHFSKETRQLANTSMIYRMIQVIQYDFSKKFHYELMCNKCKISFFNITRSVTKYAGPCIVSFVILTTNLTFTQ